MLIAGYLRKDFIEKSLELPREDLESLLSCFKDTDYMLVIKDPEINISKILKFSIPKTNQSKIDLWKNTLIEINRKGRYFNKVSQEIIESSKPKVQKNTINISDKKLNFYIKALRGKISTFSNKKTEENDILFDIKSFSSTLFSFCPELVKRVFENNKKFILEDIEVNKNISYSKFENLFFEKIAGYLCFNDTAIIFDQYIFEPCLNEKGELTKKSIIKLSEYLSQSPNLKNLIIIGPDWWNKYEGVKYYQVQSKLIKSKKEILDEYIKNIRYKFNQNRKKISINFYLIPLSFFKHQHERFFVFTNLKSEVEDFDLSNLSSKDNFISIKFDQGMDYFNDNPIKKAKIEYSSTTDFQKLLDELIVNKADDYEDAKFKKDCKDYWQEKYGEKSKIWIHHNQILNQ